jgi:hypothetical protein
VQTLHTPEPEPAEQQAIDPDAFIAQVADELEHCTSKDDARQVWRRYTAEIGAIKINFPDREPEIVSLFAKTTKALK